MNDLIVSICIPTYGRVEILKKTIFSIITQNIDSSLYEICISDNSPTGETEEMLQTLFSDQKNIIYKKSKCEGYLNSIEALKMGRGKLLKLHNNYTCFIDGALSSFISVVKALPKSCVIFFSNGTLTDEKLPKEFNSFDSFLNFIHYYSTWSTSFSIVKDDFDSLLSKNIELDKMFPHTSLLFALTDNDKYIVDDSLYFDNQDVGKKGGYNLPITFGARYLLMVEKLKDENNITTETNEKIKKEILNFISDWYVKVRVYKDKYFFDYSNWKLTIKGIYGDRGVKYIEKYYRKKFPKAFIKKMLGKY